MRVIQLSVRSWLVFTEPATPRYLIVEGPLVHRETGETHMMHRVEWWHIDPKQRNTLSVHDSLGAAQRWCKADLDARETDQARLHESLARKGF